MSSPIPAASAPTPDPGSLVGLCAECGAVAMAHVIRPEYAKHVAKFAADAVKGGYRLETWPTQRVREAQWDCEHIEARRNARKPKKGMAQHELI